MKFDYTKGKKARYLVNIYGWNASDQYYFHYFREAKEMFNNIKEKSLKEGRSVSIYDLTKDIRKEFAKTE